MAENRGKQFEGVVKEAIAKVPETSIIRLIDPQNGFAGVRNICDFIVYHYPVQLFLECKSCHGNRFPFSNVTENQWRGLLEQSKINGVRAGVLVWFIDKDATYFLDIQLLEKLKSEGVKSVSYEAEWISDNPIRWWSKIPGKKKRVFFDYDMKWFIEKEICDD